MAVRLRKAHAVAALSLTPLIDVVFLLQVFFLVTARFAEDERRMDVMLPSADQARPMVSEFRELVINIDEQGQLFLGTEPVPADQLQEMLKRLAGDQPMQQSVLIRADRRCDWEAVIQVMDACHATGIRDIYPMTASDP